MSVDSSIIKFTPLSGALQDLAPPCYLLQVDDFKFLLDCGWDENFSSELIENIKKHAHQVDAILLSHPDIDHLGALPYVHGKLGMKCPIFATVPVYRMGQMFMYDLYQSHYNSEDFTLFDLDDVDSAFDHITRLKYSQTYRLQRKGLGLTITPYPSGHTVGGTIWRIIKDDEEDIVYAPEYSHRKERHLDGAVFESLTRPHLFITDANNALMAQERRKDRDRKLIGKHCTCPTHPILTCW
jgi:cleavage and polyadenylation specificity factor subunit 2